MSSQVIKGKVAAVVDKYTILINKGSKEFVQTGMQFKIYPKGSRITVKDPDNQPGKEITLVIYEPTITVSQVFEDYSLCVTETRAAPPTAYMQEELHYLNKSLLDGVNPITEGDAVEGFVIIPVPIESGLWTARNQLIMPINPWGADYGEIQLSGKTLQRLTFRVNSTAPYWRAGVKLEDPNGGNKIPKLVTEGSLLFHVGRTDNEYTATYYPDGTLSRRMQVNLKGPYEQGLEIDIRHDNSKISCYVNGALYLNTFLSPEWYKRAYIAAWGDGKECEVHFDNILTKAA